MTRRNLALSATLKGALLAATLFTAPAFAQTATPEGAKQLRDALAKTFGPAPFDKGVVTIAPRGAAYAVKIDFNALRGDAEKAGATFDAAPITYLATPNADGTYAVASESPISFAFSSKKAGETFDAKFAIEGCKTTGVFDPKIAYFSTLDMACPKASFTLHSPEQDIDMSLGAYTTKVTGKPSGSGGTTVGVTSAASDFSETIAVKDKAAPFTAVVRAKQLAQEATADNYQIAPILEVVSAIANAGGTKDIIAQQGAIKQKIVAALPLWQNVGVRTSLTEASIGTPIGIIKLASLEYGLGLTGLVKDGAYTVGLKYAGLELPKGPVPDWASPLVPTQGNLDLTFSGVDLDTMGRLVIQNFDAAKKQPLPDSLTAQLIGLFAKGQPRLTLAPSTFTASAGAVSAEGAMSVFPSQKGKVTVSATNLDAMIESVNKADLPDKQKALIGLTMAKGLAKTGPDGKAVWNVEFDAATKAVKVNGQSFGGPKAGAGAEDNGDDSGDGETGNAKP